MSGLGGLTQLSSLSIGDAINELYERFVAVEYAGKGQLKRPYPLGTGDEAHQCDDNIVPGDPELDTC